MVIVISILLIIISSYCFYLYGKTQREKELTPLIQHREEVNNEIIQENQRMEQEYNEYIDAIKSLSQEKDSLSSAISDLNRQADESAKEYREKAFEIAQLQLEASLTEEAEKYQNSIDEYRAEYLQTMEDSMRTMTENLSATRLSYDKLAAQVREIKSQRDALIQANLREKEIEDNISFYTLPVSETDLADIRMLNSLKSSLHKPEILSKLIWSTYFLQNTNTLCANVIGPGEICGIYKITNINTKEVYIGQSKNISERFKQHIKAGLGIDNSGSNKLYKAMQAQGVWNFSFELLEKCSPDILDQKEKEYISIYQSNTYGYNVTAGNGVKKNG